MNSKQLLIGVALIAIAVASIIITISTDTTNEIVTDTDSQTAVETTSDTTTSLNDSPTANGEEERGTEGYTAADVALHTSQDDCWTIINDSVYDLTPFTNQHPGGTNNIIKLCGIDGTTIFEEQHGGQANAESQLESLYLGP